MKGTRSLDNDEIRASINVFRRTFQVRDRGLFMLGVSTGGRISVLPVASDRRCVPKRFRGNRYAL